MNRTPLFNALCAMLYVMDEDEHLEITSLRVRLRTRYLTRNKRTRARRATERAI